MEADQKTLKQGAIRSLILGLGKGVSLNPKLHLNKVIGLDDATMYTPKFNRAAKTQKEGRIGSLAENIVSSEDLKQRTFAINSGHTRPFFRKSEFRRMKSAAIALEKISTKN